MDVLLSSVSRSLLVSSLVPAIVFVSITLYTVAPGLPRQFLEHLNIGTSDSTLASILAIIIPLSFVLGYTLMIVNWIIVRLYEGYYIKVPFGKQLEIWRKRTHLNNFNRLKQHAQDTTKPYDEYERHWRQYIEAQSGLTFRFPDNVKSFLSTRLGNIYRAFEEYPYRRYGMNGVFFWPRIANVISLDYANKIQELNNAIAFLLNSSLMSFLIGLEIIIWKLVGINWKLLETGGLQWQTVRTAIFFPGDSTSVLIVIVCWGLFYIFYHAAVSTAATYGQYICTSYDLFRLKFLKSLQLPIPDILGGEEEKTLWCSVHEFLTLAEGSPYRKKPTTQTPQGVLKTLTLFVCAWGELFFWQTAKSVLSGSVKTRTQST